MVEKASLAIGVDTGLTHMAIAFDRPTVTLFGSNIPYTLTPTDRARVIVHWLDCSPCRSNPTCGGAFTCTELITVDQVMETALEVLANAGGGRGTFGTQDPGRASGAGEPGNGSQNPGSHPSTSGNASREPGG
jgi:hypothetical protein